MVTIIFISQLQVTNKNMSHVFTVQCKALAFRATFEKQKLSFPASEIVH